MSGWWDLLWLIPVSGVIYALRWNKSDQDWLERFSDWK